MSVELGVTPLRERILTAGLLLASVLLGILVGGPALADPAEPPSVLSTPESIPPSVSPTLANSPTPLSSVRSASACPSAQTSGAPISPVPQKSGSSRSNRVVPRSVVSPQVATSSSLPSSVAPARIGTPSQELLRWWEQSQAWFAVSIMIIAIGAPLIGIWWFFWLRRPA